MEWVDTYPPPLIRQRLKFLKSPQRNDNDSHETVCPIKIDNISTHFSWKQIASYNIIHETEDNTALFKAHSGKEKVQLQEVFSS